MSYLVKTLGAVGTVALLSWQVFASSFRRPFLVKNVFEQMVLIAFNSTWMVVLIASSVGMVVSLQLGTTLEENFPGGSNFIGSAIGVSFCAELGPVLMCLMLSGRVGASIAAEIAAMKISEQLDALVSLSVDPVHYLLVPRMLAAVLLFPFLALLADLAGIFGGYIAAFLSFDQSLNVFILDFQRMVTFTHVFGGLAKACFFAFLMVVLGSYYGLQSSYSASGIGEVTRKTVVTTNILIVILDYFFSKIIIWFFG